MVSEHIIVIGKKVKIMSENKIKWTTRYINSLPDAAFAYIEPGGKKDSDGKTVPRSLRHFPHHNMSVKRSTEHNTVDRPHLRNALARAPQSSHGSKALSHLKIHAKALKIGAFKIGGKFNQLKSKSRRIIAGYASYVMVDAHSDIVTKTALQDALKRFMKDKKHRNIMYGHDNVQVGDLLDKFGPYTTHVDDKGLFIVAEIRTDLKTSDFVWEKILVGEVNAYSISFEQLEETPHVTDGVWEEIQKINLVEISVCEFPANALSRFNIISKSKNVLREKIGDSMSETELKKQNKAANKEVNLDELIDAILSLNDEDRKALKEKADIDISPNAGLVKAISAELERLKGLGDAITGLELSMLADLVTQLQTGQKPEDIGKSKDGISELKKSVEEILKRLDAIENPKADKTVVIKNKTDNGDEDNPSDDKGNDNPEDKGGAGEDKGGAGAEDKGNENKDSHEDILKDFETVKSATEENRKIMSDIQESVKTIEDRITKIEETPIIKTGADTDDGDIDKDIKDYQPDNVRMSSHNVETRVEIEEEK
jgi:HK97 family phage prohead protease